MKYYRMKPQVIRAAQEDCEALHRCGHPELLELFGLIQREILELIRPMMGEEQITYTAVAEDLPVRLPLQNGKLVGMPVPVNVIVKKTERELKQEVRRKEDALRRLRRQH
jgi:hypothetical protein